MRRDTPLLAALATTGLAALALEVLWSRAMIPWVGGTALSQIATVAIYMTGLFAGSALAVPFLHRIADPRRTFLRAEMTAAVLSLAAVLGLPLADPVFSLFSKGDLLGSALGSLLRGLSGGGLMLPATILMGFSFPLAIAALDRNTGDRGSAALAYGVNTIGATVGTLLGGFVLVPWLGVTNGAIAIVVADVVVLAWIMRTKAPGMAVEVVGGGMAKAHAAPAKRVAVAAPAAPTAERDVTRWREELPMLASILIGGMVALGLEAILFRVLGLLLGPTARAFTVVLAVYVLGLGIGSLLVRPLVERGRKPAEMVYLACWLVVGAYGLVVHLCTGWISDFVATGRASAAFDLTAQLARRAGIATVVLLPITCAFGASYSAAVAAGKRSGAGRAGRLYAALTLGNILGLAVAAWVVLPWFGLDRGLLLVLASAFLAPIPALTATALPALARVGVAVLLLAGGSLAWFVVPGWPMRLLHTAAYMYDPATQAPVTSKPVVRFHESAFETSVTVVQNGEDLYLQLDGKSTGSTNVDDQATQGLLGALTAALHPAPKRAFVIGLGTGQTPAEVLRFAVGELDCAEISPEVVLTMPYFEMINRRCDLDRRFRMLEADGRTVLRYGDKKYDLVISEPSNVWIPGVAHLFTRESFEDVRGCLAEGGLCVQWMQGYTLDVDSLRAIVRTFLEVFPNASLWFSGLANPDVFLVGSHDPLRIDARALQQRLAAAGTRNVLARGKPFDAVDVLRRFIAGPEALRRFAGAGPLTSDARPSLEYAAEAALLGGAADPARRLIAEWCEPPVALLVPGPDGPDLELERTLARRAEANRAVSRQLAEIHDRQGQPGFESLVEGCFTIATTFPDDVELHSALMASLFFPIRLQLAQIERSGGAYPPELIQYIRRVIAIDPENHEALKFAALFAQFDGRRDEALLLLDRYAKAAEPWRVMPWLDRAMLLWNLGRGREAIELMKQATTKSPKFVTAWGMLLKMARATGDVGTAAQADAQIRKLQSDRVQTDGD